MRTAAGAAFSIIFRGGAGGGSAVDSVVPSMLEGAGLAWLRFLPMF